MLVIQDILVLLETKEQRAQADLKELMEVLGRLGHG